MAQKKIGLDYYAHNVGMTSDRRLRVIRREFGSSGIDVWFTLLDMVYSRCGYFLSFGEKQRLDVAWDIAGEVRGRGSPDEDEVLRIIHAFVEAGLLDEAMYRRGIITSVAIQEQYYMSTLKRKQVMVDKNIWLLSVEEMKRLSPISSILESFSAASQDDGITAQNDGILNSNDDIKASDSDILPQSKVNNKIKNNKKEEESKVKLSSDESDKASYCSCTAQNSFLIEASPERGALVQKYGDTAVCEYERRFFKWKAKNRSVNVDMYAEIQKWMSQDLAVPDPLSKALYGGTLDTQAILQDAMELYR